MNETVAIAAQLMRAGNISALVVKDVCRTEGNVAVGMFSERDVVRAIASHGAAGVDLKVSSLISVQELISCRSTASEISAPPSKKTESARINPHSHKRVNAEISSVLETFLTDRNDFWENRFGVCFGVSK